MLRVGCAARPMRETGANDVANPHIADRNGPVTFAHDSAMSRRSPGYGALVTGSAVDKTIRVRIRTLVVLAWLGGAVASASPTVTIVVTGDATLESPTAAQIGTWLRGHGRAPGAPLEADATKTLVNCFVLDDHSCARGVVDKRSSSDEVVYALVERVRAQPSTITITMFWLVKSHEPVGEHRACEECSEDVMRGKIDMLLDDLSSAAMTARGRIKVHSKPEGMTVLLDNERIGVTPIERELPAGPHTIVLTHRGHRVGDRDVMVQANENAEIAIPVTEVEPPPSNDPRLAAGLALGIGAVALGTGVALYATSETDDGSKPTYRDTKSFGIAVGASGIVLLAVGAYLWLHHGENDSGPTASLDAHGGMVGWARAF